MTRSVMIAWERDGKESRTVFSVPPAEEAEKIIKEWNKAHSARVTKKNTANLDNYTVRIFGKEFFVSEFYSDRAWGIENSRVTGPDGRVFIRHFNDCNEMIAFVAAEIR